ncbi:MAG TPA: 2OG-Fe(II) oxygenase [Pirellulales bacterium]|nr:2OG-Fe(II) oxygenase [Pirellulales bacterium]
MTTEYEQISDEIFTVSGLLTPAECAEYIDLGEAQGFAPAPINGAFGPAYRPEVRNNERVMLDDPDRAAKLCAQAWPWIPKQLGLWRAVGVNERLRLYRYDPGQQFAWHTDGSFERPNGEKSWLTFMVYLNEGFDGGRTVFSSVQIAPEQGMALFFKHELRHKGETVLQGRKYVLRTDVMYVLD